MMKYKMIDYAHALELILSEVKDFAKAVTEIIPIQHSIGRINAETVVSSESLPAFNNSAMDGFALVAEQTALASEENPLEFEVNQIIAAGDNISEKEYQATDATEIMTGAAVPSEYNAVIPIENVELIHYQNQEGAPKAIRITEPVKAGKNIRLVGEDVLKGATLFEKGERIRPKHLMTLAALGIHHITVYKKPKITLICTGKELGDGFELNTKNKPGQIRNSNGPYLTNALSELGCDVNYVGGITDDPALFIKEMDGLLNEQPDIIITTGAVSMGKWDFIPKALSELGADIIFHKAKIRPGKPILFAKFGDAIKPGPLFFGLPGNPVSAIVGFRFFVTPLIRTLSGLPKEKPIYAKLTADIEKKEHLRYFLKAKMESQPSGEMQVELLTGQESFKITPLLRANCWAVLEEGHESYRAGDVIEVFF